MTVSKSILRKKYLDRRNYLNTSEISEMSLKIFDNLQSLNIWNYSYYHCFLTMEHRGEIDTKPIIDFLCDKSKVLICSRSNFKDYTMTNYIVNANTKIEVNKFGIPEPSLDSTLAQDELIEIVFVPLLAFDRNGYRVGYGKGFYDRMMQMLNPQTIKIGLSLFDQDSDIIEVDQYDVALDYCVTPHKVYRYV